MNRQKYESPMVTAAEISVFSYATEDEDKVVKAVQNIFSRENLTQFNVQKISGYHKDPILFFQLKIKNKKTVGNMFHNLLETLSILDQHRLLDEIANRVDNAGNLYLRFDKQKAYISEPVLKDSDPIHVKFSFRLPHGVVPSDAILSLITSTLDSFR